jgi:hypothetical protein
MRTPQPKSPVDRAFALKQIIIRQQGLAARLLQEGKIAEAQRARSRLQVLLNQLDLVQELLPRRSIS